MEFSFLLLFCLNFRSFCSERLYLKVKQKMDDIKIKKLRKKKSMKDVHNNPQPILSTTKQKFQLFSPPLSMSIHCFK